MNNAFLSNFEQNLRVAVVGASGGLGSTLVNQLANLPNVNEVLAYSRSNPPHFSHQKISEIQLDISSEQQIQAALSQLTPNSLDIVIIATGTLHTESIVPEKSMASLSMENFESIFRVNTFGPMLSAKYFLPCLNRDRKSVFAVLSARVGSISDNNLGGWYSYRASKAALNMLLKNLAIETSRRNNKACIIGLHPGTVDTPLSKPFQRQVPPSKLFTPKQSTAYLLKVINKTTSADTGKIFAWDGQVIPP